MACKLEHLVVSRFTTGCGSLLSEEMRETMGRSTSSSYEMPECGHHSEMSSLDGNGEEKSDLKQQRKQVGLFFFKLGTGRLVDEKADQWESLAR